MSGLAAAATLRTQSSSPHRAMTDNSVSSDDVEVFWLSDHETRVAEAAVSPDGDWMLTAARNPFGSSLLRLWRLDRADGDGRLHRTHKMTHGTAGVGFSPDGETYAAASGCYISQFLTATGRRIRSIKVVENCAPGMPPVACFAWSPDGEVFAVTTGGSKVELYAPAERGLLEYLAPAGTDELDEWATLGCGRGIGKLSKRPFNWCATTLVFSKNFQATDSEGQSSYLAVAYERIPLGTGKTQQAIAGTVTVYELFREGENVADVTSCAALTFPAHERTKISGVSFSPDAWFVAYALHNGFVYVRNIMSKGILSVIACRRWQRPSSVVFVDDTLLAVGFEFAEEDDYGQVSSIASDEQANKSGNSVRIYHCAGAGRLVSEHDSSHLNVKSLSYSFRTGHLFACGTGLRSFTDRFGRKSWMEDSGVRSFELRTARTIVIDALVRNLADGAPKIEFVAGTGLAVLARITKRMDHLLRRQFLGDVFEFVWATDYSFRAEPVQLGDPGQTEDRTFDQDCGGAELLAAGAVRDWGRPVNDMRGRNGRDYISRLKAKLKTPDGRNPAMTRLRRVEFDGDPNHGEFEGDLADWDLLPEPEVDPAPRRVPGTPKYDDWD